MPFRKTRVVDGDDLEWRGLQRLLLELFEFPHA